jgi:ABC-2 type transport system ATP-binding protein
MDDIEALCSEVTIVATGRVVFSGPLGKLAAENDDLDYRLVTSDPDAARELILAGRGVRLVEESEAGMRLDARVLVVRAQTPALDELVARLVTAGIAVRELAPVVSPLEAAFLALTEQEGLGR